MREAVLQDIKTGVTAHSGLTGAERVNKKTFLMCTCGEKSERYFNAGVILFNLQKMRKSVTTEDIFSYIRKNEKRLYLADQDVLNGMFGKQALIVDERLYNLDEKTVSRYKITNDIWIRKNTVIVHFNGKFKPWKENYKGVLARYWFEYLETEQKKLYTKVG